MKYNLDYIHIFLNDGAILIFDRELEINQFLTSFLERYIFQNRVFLRLRGEIFF